MRGAGELGHVETDLGDEDLGGSFRDAGHLVEAFHGCEPVGVGVVFDRDIGRWGEGLRVGRWRWFGQVGDELFDPGGEPPPPDSADRAPIRFSF